MWQKRKPWSDNNTCNFKIKNKQKLPKTTLIDYFNRSAKLLEKLELETTNLFTIFTRPFKHCECSLVFCNTLFLLHKELKNENVIVASCNICLWPLSLKTYLGDDLFVYFLGDYVRWWCNQLFEISNGSNLNFIENATRKSIEMVVKERVARK
jgi:hypothetical protein